MADLTGKPIPDGYPNLVTIGATTDDNPTTGTLENGKGNNLTSVTFDGAVVVNESGGNNDFRVEGDSEANLIFADASADRVGIGTNSPLSKLSVVINDTTSTPEILIGNGDASARSALLRNQNDATSFDIIASASPTADKEIRFFTDTGTERMKIDSNGDVGIGTSSPAKELDVNGEIRASGGILFGSDTAAANTLDDYEEGTWTPVYTPVTGSFTTMTMGTNNGTYTKIGRQVTVRAFIATNEVVVGTASGSLRISGLPFASAGGSNGYAGAIASFTQNWSSPPDSAYVRDGESIISLMKTNSTITSDVSDLTTGAVASRNRIILTATYFT